MAPVVLSLGGGNMVDKYLINGSVVIDVFGGKEDDAVCVLAGRIPVGPPESHNGAEKGHLFIQPLLYQWILEQSKGSKSIMGQRLRFTCLGESRSSWLVPFRLMVMDTFIPPLLRIVSLL